ncbi:MAG: flagellar motor protein MotB [Pseudomonadota bacterium]
MARKKKPEKHANHERWLVSYADFITLLFAVFVTLYAMSQTDKQKVDQVAASYRSAFGISAGSGGRTPNILNSSEIMPLPSLQIVPPPPAKIKRTQEDTEKIKGPSESGKKSQVGTGDFQDIKKSIKVSLKSPQLVGEVTVEESSRGLAIRLQDEAIFEPGTANIKPEALPLIGKIAGALAFVSDHQIRIEGHTDNTTVFSSSYQTNWELSLARAASVMRIFLTHYDYSPVNISIAGYGQYRPIASNDTEAGRKRNRRVDIILLETKGEKPVL